MVEWLWGWSRTHTGGAEWGAVALLCAFIVGAVVAVGLLRRRSHRWAVANRTHTLFIRNERSVRSEATRALDEALRNLGWVRRALRGQRAQEDALGLSSLIRRVEVVRDKVAAGYTPGVVNAGEDRFELDLGAVLESCDLRDETAELVRNLMTGASVDLTGLEQALERWAHRELVPR